MMTLYCDESDDGKTYALAGWLAVPTAWDGFEPEWRAMLKTLKMPDGSECRAFHAADIVGRDEIKGSPFKGWTFGDEIAAFSKAIAVVENTKAAALLWPVGVAFELPASFSWMPRDMVWLFLFISLFDLLTATYPAQRSIALMLDEKKSVENNALQIHAIAKGRYNEVVAEEYLSNIAFDDDKVVIPLQAADLLAYEWRKRISDETARPEKPVRKSYARIRSSRPDGALWRYGRSLFDEAAPRFDSVRGASLEDQIRVFIPWFSRQKPTHHD